MARTIAAWQNEFDAATTNAQRDVIRAGIRADGYHGLAATIGLDAIHPVDAAYAAMMAANRATPYDRTEYDRAERVFEATVMVAVGGDGPYAAALVHHFHDSGEDFAWYTTQWTRDQFVAL